MGNTRKNLKVFQPEGQTYGLDSLSGRFLTTMQQGIDFLENAHLLHLDFDAHSIRNARTQLPEILEEKNATKAFDRLSKILAALSDEQKKKKAYQWRKAQGESLQKDGLINQLKNAASTEYKEEQVGEIGNSLQAMGRFSADVPDCAVDDAFPMLQALGRLFKYALKELESRKKSINPFRRRMSKEVYDRYKEHLDEQINIINEENNCITMSMYERLKAAERNQDLLASDVLMSALTHLKSLGVIKKDFGLEQEKRHGSTKEVFLRFHNAIEKNGSERLCYKLHDLCWLNSGKVALYKGSSKLRIGARFGLQEFIPTAPGKAGWFFKGTNIRKKFFDDFYNLANLEVAFNKLNNIVAGGLDEPNISNFMIQMSVINRFVQNEAARIDEARQSLLGWPRRLFSKKTLTFLDEYETRLGQEVNERIKTHARFIGRITAMVERDAVELTPVLAEQAECLKDFARIHAGETTSDFSREIFEKEAEKLEKAIKNRSENKLKEQKQREEKELQKALLQPINAQTIENPAGVEDIDAMLCYYNNLKDSSDTSTTQFLEEINAYIETAKSEFERISRSFEDNPQETKIQFLINLGRLIQGLCRADERSFVQRQLEPFLFSYINLWNDKGSGVDEPIEKKHKISTQREAVLLSLCDEEEKKQVASLRKLRRQGRFVELNEKSEAITKSLKGPLYSSQLINEFKSLDRALLKYLRSITRLKISDSIASRINRWCNEMAEKEITNIAQYNGLEKSDKTFIGLQPDAQTVSRQIKWTITPTTQPLPAVINICAMLRIKANKLLRMEDVDQILDDIKKAKQFIQNEINPCRGRLLGDDIATGLISCVNNVVLFEEWENKLKPKALSNSPKPTIKMRKP